MPAGSTGQASPCGQFWLDNTGCVDGSSNTVADMFALSTNLIRHAHANTGGRVFATAMIGINRLVLTDYM